MASLIKAAAPKSDQLNADDLIGGVRTLEITSVKVGSGEQPISIHFVGDNGKPYKPCKSMARVFISAWGEEGDNYIGRKIIIFLDSTVRWAGKEVGGIRISHMSDIKKDLYLPLTVSQGKRAVYHVAKLEPITPQKEITTEEYSDLENRLNIAETLADLQPITADIKKGNYLSNEDTAKLGEVYNETKNKIRTIIKNGEN